MKAIRTEDLTKLFDDLVAVDQVSLEIEPGELFGMLGPNGAGKTTFAKMLSTLLKPTSGYAEVWGNDVTLKQDEVRRCIGVVFQDPAIDDQLTGWENLDFHARMYGMDRVRHLYEENQLAHTTTDAFFQKTRRALRKGFESRGVAIDEMDDLDSLMCRASG